MYTILDLHNPVDSRTAEYAEITWKLLQERNSHWARIVPTVEIQSDGAIELEYVNQMVDQVFYLGANRNNHFLWSFGEDDPFRHWTVWVDPASDGGVVLTIRNWGDNRLLYEESIPQTQLKAMVDWASDTLEKATCLLDPPEDEN